MHKITKKNFGKIILILLGMIVIFQVGFNKNHFQDDRSSASPDKLVILSQDNQRYQRPFLVNVKSGQMRHLADFGKGIFIIKFWAHWCPSCLDEFNNYASFKTLINKYSNIKSLNISSSIESSDDERKIFKILKKYSLDPKTTFLDVENEVFNKFGILALPSIVFIFDGEVIYKYESQLQFIEEFEEDLKVHLANRPNL